MLAAQTLGEEENETAHHLKELKTMVKEMLDRFKAGVRMYKIGSKVRHEGSREHQFLYNGLVVIYCIRFMPCCLSRRVR